MSCFSRLSCDDAAVAVALWLVIITVVSVHTQVSSYRVALESAGIVHNTPHVPIEKYFDLDHTATSSTPIR